MPTPVITPEFWIEYADQQRFLDSEKLNAKSFARDDSISQLLDEAASGVTLPQVDSLFRSHLGRSQNRSSTLRNRKRLDREVVPFASGCFRIHWQNGEQVIVSIQSTNASKAVDYRDQLADLQRRVSTEDWELLTSLAAEETYAALSYKNGNSILALKSRTSRCRKILRHSC